MHSQVPFFSPIRSNKRVKLNDGTAGSDQKNRWRLIEDGLVWFSDDRIEVTRVVLLHLIHIKHRNCAFVGWDPLRFITSSLTCKGQSLAW